MECSFVFPILTRQSEEWASVSGDTYVLGKQEVTTNKKTTDTQNVNVNSLPVAFVL